MEIAKLADQDYNRFVGAIADGNVVFFLGAGVNLWGRRNHADDPTLATPQDRLPDGRELARYLAGPDWPANKLDLLRVSQYVDLMEGSGPLYQKLRRLFNRNYQATPLHEFLAHLPATLKAKGCASVHSLIVTTNYDYVLERAFETEHREFDQVTYIADGENRGKFLLREWRIREGDATRIPIPAGCQVIQIPNEYSGLSLSRNSIILKIHGAVDVIEAERDSFVITEDHYIDYLARTDSSNFLPVNIAAKLKNSHILFIGYGLRDWNLRVVLQRIWGTRHLTWTSWAIQSECEDLDGRFWAKRDVEILEGRMEDFLSKLEAHLGALPDVPAREES